MDAVEPIRDLFQDEKLAEEFEKAAMHNTLLLSRPAFEIGEPEDVKVKQDTFELAKYFAARMGYFLYFYKKGELKAIDFFKERGLLDIIELYHARGIEYHQGSIEHYIEAIKKILKDEIGADPKRYTNYLEDSKKPVETEEEMDKILLSMLYQKLDNNGRAPQRYSTFVLRQCFYPKSAITKNKEKYEEAVYRFLEEFAKCDAVANNHILEKNINSSIKRMEYFSKRNYKKHFGRNMEIILSSLRELVKKGWIFNIHTLEKVSDLLQDASLNPKDRRTIEGLLARAYYSEKIDNSPIVIIPRQGVLQAKADTNGRIIRLSQNHIKDFVWGFPNEQIDVINTIYHENTHVTQHRDYRNPDSYLRYLQLKIKLLTSEDEELKDKNYFVADLREREAYIAGARKALAFAKDNQINIPTHQLEREIYNQEKLLEQLILDSIPFITTENGEDKKEKLSSVFEKFLMGKLEETKRENIGGDDWLELLVEKNALPKYTQNPSKEIEIEDFILGENILRDNPVLRIEYNDDGSKRTFSEFLRNAKKLICTYRFMGSDKGTGIYVDENMVNLIKEIAVHEYFKVENLPEILYNLSKDDIQFDEKDPRNKNSLFKNFIRTLTLENLGPLLQEAADNIDSMPLEKLEQSLQMCKLIHTFEVDDKEKQKKRSEFLKGLEIPNYESKKKAIDVMKEFEEVATRRLESKKAPKKTEGPSFDDD